VEARKILVAHKFNKLVYKEKPGVSHTLGDLISENKLERLIQSIPLTLDSDLLNKLANLKNRLLDSGGYSYTRTLLNSCEVLEEKYRESILGTHKTLLFRLYDTTIHQNPGHRCPYRWFEFKVSQPCMNAEKASKTLDELNMFYNLWQGATKKPGQEGKNEYVPIEVHWSQVPLYPGGPLRDHKWKLRTIKQLGGGAGGEHKFQSEYDCDFIGSSNTLISSAKLHILSAKAPQYRTKEGLTVYEEPREGRVYVMTVDTSRGQGNDYSAAVMFDITETPYRIVAKYRNNIVSPMLLPTIISAFGKKYNNAYVLVEVNDIGGQVADILHYDLEYDNILMSMNKGRSGMVLNGGFGKGESLFGVRTTVTVKKLGCSILKSLVEQDKLLIEDEETINELLSFVAKYNTFAADDGHTDDLVMCLVLFSWLTKQSYFKELTNIDIRKELFDGEIKKIEDDDWFSFGFISTYDSDDG
ncbi:MAG: hypothetical protein EB127_26735, partial [Alphaproteobacteria bacterium]|nr:hypothetical protein [Alphaproteobacteria bacterium]